MSLDCAGLVGADEVDAAIAGAAGLVAAGLEVTGLPSNRGGFVGAEVVVTGESADAGVGTGKGLGGKAADAGDRAAGKRLGVAVADVVEAVIVLSVPATGALPKRLEEATVAVDGVAGTLLPPNSGPGVVVLVGVDVAAGVPPKKGFGAVAPAAPPKSDGGVDAAEGAIDEGAVKRNVH